MGLPNVKLTRISDLEKSPTLNHKFANILANDHVGTV